MNHHSPPESLLPPEPDAQVGLVFRRLAGVRETYGEPALDRAVRATLVTLGRVAHEEAEAQARHLAERLAPPRPGVRVTSTARRHDADAFETGEDR
ncbi:hypothetical protein [Methylobacterium pseudosasicola]|uniref:Uncharacterized protein n=1 Tax=Methylobacterium pseudosasicola TaxID=582667 RepID=A0A1I4PTN2_9HYPH|nr:hypothetical protein [Methylobacterium pseudosasicola]SFM31202.1 hypothetical protein SAMN05192568_102662 [Methylobacterium pseudosasicola]